MYGKHFQSMYTGSMVGAGAHVYAVWGYIIAHTKPDSKVEINTKVVAMLIGMTESEVELAIKYLSDSDDKSRSKDMQGKRIIKEGEYIYHVINFNSYRYIKNDEERREKDRIRQRKHRENKKNNMMSHVTSQTVTPSNNNSYTDSDTYTNNISSEQSSSLIVAIPLKNKKEFSVTENLVNEWKEAYPSIDVIAELKKIKQWNLDNPDKRKTERGVRRHINSWLSRKSPTAMNAEEIPGI